MKVTKSTDATTPKYPSNRQFLKSGAIIGAAALGLGALATGCISRTLGKMPTRSTANEPEIIREGGIMPIEPVHPPGLIRAESNSYVAKPGDTLYSIAKANLGKGSRWRDIVALNTGLTPANLKAGQTIRLPDVAP